MNRGNEERQPAEICLVSLRPISASTASAGKRAAGRPRRRRALRHKSLLLTVPVHTCSPISLTLLFAVWHF